MPTYGGATSNSKVTVSHECARSSLGLQAHCPESALAAARRALHFRFHAAADRHSRRASLLAFTGDTTEVVADELIDIRLCEYSSKLCCCS